MSDQITTTTRSTSNTTMFGTRESGPTDAVPRWLFLEVPITHSEAKALYSLKQTDGRPDLVLRALMLRYIYGGEGIRESMMGGVSR